MRRALPLVCAVALLASCSARTPEIDDLPTGSIEPSPEPSPTETEEADRTPRARLAVLTDGDRLFLYDARADRLTDVASGGNLAQPAIIARDQVSFVKRSEDSSNAALMLLDLETQALSTVLEVSTGIYAYGWSPDRSTIAYITVDERSFPVLRYRRVGGTQTTRSVATLARAPGRGFAPDDQVKIEWSPDGTMVLVVFTPADGDPQQRVPDEQSQLQVRAADSSLVFAARHRNEPTMAAWAPDGSHVYFRTATAVRAWDVEGGGLDTIANDVRWFDPWVSPDGDRIAFDTGQHRAGARVRVLDLRTGSITTVGARGRFHPVFARANQVWVQALRACPETEGCLYGTEPTDDVYAIDLRTGDERRINAGKLVGIDVLYR